MAFAPGRNRLYSPLLSDDTEAAFNVLNKIGVKIIKDKEHWDVYGNEFNASSEDLYCGDSAATLRFMTAICPLVPGISRLTAGPSLSKRPVRPLIEALRKWGVDASCEGDFAPVTIVGGGLKGGFTEIPGDISSQFVSALLLVAPLAGQKSRIRLSTSLESQSYVRMTLECLLQFGIKIKHSDDWMEYVATPQEYKNTDYTIEGDWSSASYLLALGAVGGSVAVKGLNASSLQGDRIILDLLKEMGASVNVAKEEITIKKKSLKAIKADLNESIDLLPTMAALAAVADGTSEFTGIKRARLKESDRILAVKQGLERVGIKVIEEPDKLTITGGKSHHAVIDSHSDHRIAMAFSVIGAAAGGITIDGAECVTKTYPEYWNTIRQLGVKIDEQ